MKRLLLVEASAAAASGLKRARITHLNVGLPEGESAVQGQDKQARDTVAADRVPVQVQTPVHLKHNTATDLGSGSAISYYPRYMQNAAKRLLQSLMLEVPWEQRDVRIMGRSVPQPRLICYMADEGMHYTYSGLTLQPQPWSAAVQEVKAAAEKLAGCHYNSCLLNYYRNGDDSIGWHSDNEPLYGQEPTIASVSFGETRDFVLRHTMHRQSNVLGGVRIPDQSYHLKAHKISIPLAAGDVLLMMGTTQQHWQHSMPRRKKAMGPRVSLTFRNIVQPDQQHLQPNFLQAVA